MPATAKLSPGMGTGRDADESMMKVWHFSTLMRNHSIINSGINITKCTKLYTGIYLQQKSINPHKNVKSKNNNFNDITIIGRTIFVENWLWRPSCFSEIVENQYQPILYPYYYYKIWRWYIHNFSFNWSDVVKMLSQQNLQVPSWRPFCFNLIAPRTKTSKVLWLLTCTSNLETIAWTALL